MSNRTRGLCAWCREAVMDTEPRYESAFAAVHAECMRAYLLELEGERTLAELLGFQYQEREDEDAGF